MVPMITTLIEIVMSQRKEQDEIVRATLYGSILPSVKAYQLTLQNISWI